MGVSFPDIFHLPGTPERELEWDSEPQAEGEDTALAQLCALTKLRADSALFQQATG